MSVRNDHELPRSQADASDDAHPGTYQGPLEVQEAIEIDCGLAPDDGRACLVHPRRTEGDCEPIWLGGASQIMWNFDQAIPMAPARHSNRNGQSVLDD